MLTVEQFFITDERKGAAENSYSRLKRNKACFILKFSIQRHLKNKKTGFYFGAVL